MVTLLRLPSLLRLVEGSGVFEVRPVGAGAQPGCHKAPLSNLVLPLPPHHLELELC